MMSQRFRWLICILVTAVPCAVLQPSAEADPFADSVVSVTYGDGGGFGQDSFPAIVLGPPVGAGASAGSTDVLSLGDGGSITLAFDDNIVENADGPDFIVFENAFYAGGDPHNVYCEAAFVEVSQDGVNFVRFPNDYNPDGEPVNDPQNWSGFAGIMPVFSNPDNGIDPTDPVTAGGDAFDLSDVGLDWIRYIRIVDTGEPPAAATDDDGDEIYDPGMPGGESAGFDLDAVAAIHSRELATPTPTATGIPSPSPTATPSETTLDLQLNADTFHTGDTFRLRSVIFSPATVPERVWLFVILDAEGTYFFWPGWSEAVDAGELSLPPGMKTFEILRFTWPEVNVKIDGWTFWSALVDTSGQLASNIDYEQFSFQPDK